MNKKVLIVENDEEISGALSVRMNAKGLETVVAFDAATAPGVALAENPDLVLLDIAIPGGDGFMVAERIQQFGKLANKPVIFISSSRLQGLREKANEMGAVGFFENPFDTEKLMARVAEYV